MEMISVKSSNVRSIGYDEAEKLLRVNFVSGKIYKYENVSKEVHAELMSSSSVGKYLNSKIVGKYMCRSIN